MRFIERGLRIDCAKNGCDPPHSDDGEILWRAPDLERAHRVNGHETVLVQRTVTYSPWVQIDGEVRDV